MLIPVGRQPSSSRFIDALSAGAIPVLIVDNFVKPFESLVQWSRCILQFPSTEISRVIPAIKGLSKEDVEERQRYCIFVYNEYLKDDRTLLQSVVRALKMRFMNTFVAFIEDVPLFPGRWPEPEVWTILVLLSPSFIFLIGMCTTCYPFFSQQLASAAFPDMLLLRKLVKVDVSTVIILGAFGRRYTGPVTRGRQLTNELCNL